MGNRAFITAKGADLGVYLHWNGGRDSVEAFLEYARLAGLPSLGSDNTGLPAFVTMLCNFFGNDGSTVQISSTLPNRPQDSDIGDNGVYVVEGHEIVARHGARGPEQRAHSLDGMLASIDEGQPAADRLGAFLTGVETPRDQLKVGDQVYLRRIFDDGMGTGRYRVCTVLGFRPPIKGRVNGVNMYGVPYVDMFENQDNSENINSYICTDSVRMVRKDDSTTAPLVDTASI